MNEQSVTLLAGLLKTEPSVLSEKLSSEDGVNEVKTQIESLKTFDSIGLETLKTNLRTEIKDTVYSEAKGSVLEKLERETKKKYGYDSFKKGEDYTTIDELVAKIVKTETEKSSTTDINETIKAEVEELRNKINVNSDEFDAKEKEIVLRYENEIAQNYLNGELNVLKSSLDYEAEIVGGQVELFKIKFLQDHKIKRDNGMIVVTDNEGNVLKNEHDLSPLSLTDILTTKAKSYLKFKNDSDKRGRGKENNNNKSVNINYTRFKTFEEFLSSNQGKGLKAGEIETTRHYSEWKKLQT